MPAALLLALLANANFADYPRLRSDVQAHYVSSYDRTGGNDDGFDGTYSALYVDESGEHVSGEVEIADGERLWRYQPREPWRPGRYLLQVNPRLEDRAGNSIAKPFEVDLSVGAAPEPSQEPVGLPFVVEPP